jgi:hypothetical protein
MSNAPAFSTLTLPAELIAEDVVGFRDQLHARIAALLRPKGKKHTEGDVTLPEGLEPLDKLPSHIDRPWKRFDAAATDLRTFRETRAGAQADEAYAALDETEKSAANADADDRWRAFEAWNRAAMGLAEDGAQPSPAEARWLYAQLFPPPEGLRFITRRPNVQWTAMGQRMKVLEGARAQAVLSGFGGARHYKQLGAAHARFGKAYGFTAAVIEAEGGPTDGRPQWLTAREALRVLVQKIESYADPDIEGSEALTAFLLAPYVELVTDLERSRRAHAKKPDAAPAPAKPTP